MCPSCILIAIFKYIALGGVSFFGMKLLRGKIKSIIIKKK